jgi:hypothetical protein
MFQRVGFNVEKIKRVQLGPLVLNVPPGKYRALTKREVEELKNCRKKSTGLKTGHYSKRIATTRPRRIGCGPRGEVD